MDFSDFDRTRSERLYLQVRRVILRSIQDRELLPGQKIASLNEISEMAGISRVTVRQAIESLINEGWLYTVPGKGTFVSESPHIEQSLQKLMGWTDEIRGQGMIPSSKVAQVETIALNSYIAQWLQVPAGTSAYRITRVRYANGFALTVEKAHLVCARFPGIDQRMGNESSLYKLLQDEYHVQPVRAVQFLDAGEADQAAAYLLDIEPGNPVVVSERITYNLGNDPIELVIGMHKPGFVRFRTELNLSSPAVSQVIVKLDENSRAQNGPLA